jgi:hypothetical protein
MLEQQHQNCEDFDAGFGYRTKTITHSSLGMHGIWSTSSPTGLGRCRDPAESSDDKVATETWTTVAHNSRGRVEAAPAPDDGKLAE